MMVSTSPVLGGVLLLAAGIFQWTPLKHSCLRHCHSPMSVIMHEWREGTRGAFIMGLRHGAYCTGCCWSLVALLFVAGVMNLLWVAAIAVFVLVEKCSPGRPLGGPHQRCLADCLRGLDVAGLGRSQLRITILAVLAIGMVVWDTIRLPLTSWNGYSTRI